MKNQEHIGIAERGRVVSASDELYTIESLDREGIICPGIVALAGNSFLPGDFVYFVSFADGTGCVLCNATGHVGRTPIIFYQTAPPTSGMIPGDTWIDTDGDNALYEYTLQGWVARPFGAGAIGAEIMADIAAAKQTAQEAADAALTYRLDTSYTTTLTHYVFSAHLYYGAQDVTRTFDTMKYTWLVRNEEGDELLGHGYTITLPRTAAGYVGTVVCRWTDETEEAEIVSASDDTIVSNSDEEIIGVY